MQEKSSTAPASGQTPSSPSGALRRWTPALLLAGAFWLLLFNQQRLEWTVNATYAYGWAVPFLAGYLLWERWGTRPEPSRNIVPNWVPWIIACLALVAFFPLRVIHEADPDWVKINWAAEVLCIIVSLCALAAAGGWRYVLHFGFPILFCWTALPWPVAVEDSLIQNLMKGNASMCAEIMTWCGIPALAKGNLIQVGNSMVNVEEACSGIRSLQTAFMMALFLGEFNRLRLIRRLLLLVGSFGLAALFNALRTLALTYFSTQGTLEKWHDTVGNIAMVLTLVLTWGLAELLRRFRAPQPAASPASPGKGETLRPFPLWLCIGGLVWLATCEAATAWWYDSHEKAMPPIQRWGIAWPEKARHYAETKMHDRTLALLKYNRGKAAGWISDYGYGWQMYFLEWDAGRVSKHLAQSHYPTVCLPATGLTLVNESGLWDCMINGVRIPFQTYVFRMGNEDVYVFHAIMEDRPLDPNYRHTYYQVASQERYAAVLRGERNLGQKVMGISVRGPSSPAEARYEVARTLRRIIDVTPNPVSK